jgi:hypothetical protein
LEADARECQALALIDRWRWSRNGLTTFSKSMGGGGKASARAHRDLFIRYSAALLKISVGLGLKMFGFGRGPGSKTPGRLR